MIVWTEFSTYEIEGNRVRRLEGENEPTPRQGQDQEWREAARIAPLVIGAQLHYLFLWDSEGRATITSPVHQVQ